MEFIIDTLEKDDIRLYYDRGWYPESFYLLAMLDYISRENGIPLCEAYSDLRGQTLNVIMIGNPGRGKTHLAIALGLKACVQGYNVLFKNAATLSTELCEAIHAVQPLSLSRILSAPPTGNYHCL